ncbi:maternal effect protein staufen [Drosophila busckii]|uniref:maternal effect protein staufen n=1 Tax=Drosophila busckii TaxID=30019 RepID=UPI00083F3B7A|nr:maternal effect protein staufen [Drosophila busckii]
MQHHVHAARPAPHMRGAHHHGHMPLTHPHAGMDPHLGSLTASLVGDQPQAQPPPQLDAHHGRLNHHHQQHLLAQPQGPPPPPPPNAAYHNNNSNQMQKIRQQHQNLNLNLNHSNSHSHIAKHNQTAQPYNHAAALAYGQLPPHHMAAHLGGYAAQHPPPQNVLGKNSHYYLNKHHKYNNNNNNNNNYAHVPKAIMHNTYRQAKSNSQATAVATATAAGTTSAAATTTSAAAPAVEPVTAAEDNSEPAANTETTDNSEEHLPINAVESEDCSSSVENIDTAVTLPNVDSSAGSRSSKDKTPMCLVNELARFNKITHQYRLTGERGPAHCKTFTVTLKLGEEEYSADGFKIKKAQHMAASKAIEETKYKHPPPKIRRNEETSTTRTHITPTVELNALAMKLGQRTYYLLDPSQLPPPDPMMLPDYGAPLLATPASGVPPPQQASSYAMRRNAAAAAGAYVISAPPHIHGHPHPHPQLALQPQRGIYGHQRGYGPRQSRYALPPALGGPHMMAGPHNPYAAPVPATPSKITLFVGKQKFVGIGRTLQQAKHDAAARALQVLKTQASSASEEALDEMDDEESDKKSPISQVHEIGIRRSMTVSFKVLREDGPAHMKNFITACIVGPIVTEGEGNGKKLSKKRAAEKMLAELHKLPPLTPTKQTPMKRPIKPIRTPGKISTGTNLTVALPALVKPERRNRRGEKVVKEKAVAEPLDDAENPITKLIQLQQTRKEKEPIFETIAKNGSETSRRREFLIEVSANGYTARGAGSSKKVAKRNAAQLLLEQLEAIEPKSKEQKATTSAEAKSTDESAGAGELDVPMVTTPGGLVPGILILRQNKKPNKKKDIVIKPNTEAAQEKDANTNGKEDSKESKATEAAASSESNLNTSTGSNTSGVSSNSSNATAGNSNSGGGGNEGNSSGGVAMKEQLLYLSKLMDFEVNFSDYPKGNHNEFLTIVTVTTTPPQICHGVGKSCEESQNEAARNALKILSALGLNN